MAGSYLDLITRHEGIRNRPYCDLCGGEIRPMGRYWICGCDDKEQRVGKLTIGIGHNLSARGLGPKAIDAQLKDDVNDVLLSLEKFAWFNRLDEVRQAAIIDMAFTMGIDRLLGFDRMITMLKLGAWVEAAEQMIDSDWARKEAKDRAREDSQLIRVGQWTF
jgi:lysozyme